MTLRQPIITFVGHIDHGKTSLQDYIRQSAVVTGEAGRITQHIGSSNVPLEMIKKICGPLLDALKQIISIPGLLFIDTPGHACFTNLRKRGGNLADIAILVIDINEGVMPQSLECIEILKQYKTPFIIALNKIDTLRGWKKQSGTLLQNIQQQNPQIQGLLEEKLYTLVGKLSELGFESERFDRVGDYTKQIAIVPTSALSGEGIPELLMVLVGLTQKFLENKLSIEEGHARGTVLEIKEEKGIGLTMDAIIFDGSLKLNDVLVIGTLDEPVVTKVRALLEPMPLKDIRDKKTKFQNVKEVVAASGVKIAAPDIDRVVAGMPFQSCLASEIEHVKKEIQHEIEEVIVETDQNGIVMKADSLGSLEALLKLFREAGTAVKKASIGTISKKDIADAQTNNERNPLVAAIVGFNVTLGKDVLCPENVKVFSNNVIYKLLEDFKAWQDAMRKKMEKGELSLIVRPCKILLMKGYVFRQNNPAVVGVDILGGTLKTGTPLMNDTGVLLAEAKGIQDKQENLEKAEKGQQVAISLPKVTVGRQINEGDILYSAISVEDFRKMKELKEMLSEEEKTILKEIAVIMREKNVLWGI